MANDARSEVLLLFCLLFITTCWVHRVRAGNGPEDTPSQTVVSVGKGDIKGLLLAKTNGQPVAGQGLLLFHFLHIDKKDVKMDKGRPTDLNLFLICEKCPKATTDETGKFEFKGVPVGQYTMGLGSDYDSSTITDQNALTRGKTMIVFTLKAGETVNLGTIVIKK